MNRILVFFILSACCILYANSSPTKHGCEAKPCKNDAKCIQDKNNKDKYTCECKGEYYGKACELKTGCHSSPCKNKGTCKNDVKDPSKFHCTCATTHVGDKCELENPCSAKNNPCKNGKCLVDTKHKPICTCSPGYTSAKCDKKNCTIVEHKLKNAEKYSGKLYVDKSIDHKLKDLDDIAKKCKVKLHVQSSFILHPKKEMKHDIKDRNAPGQYIGEAFTFNIYDDNNKLLCNDTCLGKSPIPMKDAKCFLDEATKKGWKWGITNPTLLYTDHPAYYAPAYNVRREEVQVGCSDGKW